MREAEERFKNGAHSLTDLVGSEPSKKRKQRTSFTPAALEVLNAFFEEKSTHPSGEQLASPAFAKVTKRGVIHNFGFFIMTLFCRLACSSALAFLE